MTWLNGIALAHSCPLRRDGRLASRFFSSSPPMRASFSVSRLARASLRKRSRKWSVLFLLFSAVATNGARLSSRNNAACLQWGKTRWLFPLDSSWIRGRDCQHSQFVLNFILISRDFSRGRCNFETYYMFQSDTDINRCVKSRRHFRRFRFCS